MIDDNKKEVANKLVDMKVDLEGYIMEIDNLISECEKNIKE